MNFWNFNNQTYRYSRFWLETKQNKIKTFQLPNDDDESDLLIVIIYPSSSTTSPPINNNLKDDDNFMYISEPILR